MPLYEFQAEDGSIIELFFHMTEDKPEYVEQSGIRYNRIFSLPNTITDSKKPKTIGDLARQNTEKGLKEGTIDKPKPKEKPWWRKGKKPNLDLAKLSDAKKRDYIMTGKTK